MLKQIRLAMGNPENQNFMGTLIEIDETYVGGKPRKGAKRDNDDDDLPKNKRGEIGLTYIFGIGRSNVTELIKKSGIDSDKRIKDLMGLSAQASIKIKNSKLASSGPLLITHWGLSGPGILRLSAWGARELHDKKYCFALLVNWLDEVSFDEAIEQLKEIKENNNKKLIGK